MTNRLPRRCRRRAVTEAGDGASPMDCAAAASTMAKRVRRGRDADPGRSRAFRKREDSMTRSMGCVLVLGLLLVGSPTIATADEKAGAKDQTVTGEVVDTFCYATMGATGTGHKQCGIDCAKKGIPVGLLEKGTDKVLVLLPPKDKTALPDAVVNKMGETVTLTGHPVTKGGVSFFT